MQELKKLNGVGGKGLLLLNRLILALSGTGVQTVEGLNFETIRDEVIATRQKVRLVLCVRTAAGVITAKRAHEVERLRQAKKLKVVLPKAIRQQLQALSGENPS